VGAEGVLPTGITTRTVLLLFTTVNAAMEAVTKMNCFTLGGIPILVDMIDDKEAAKMKSKTAAEKSATAAAAKMTKVLLDNMVSFDEATDPELKGEIAEEARNYGELKDIEIIVAPSSKTVRVVLEYTNPAAAEKAHKVMDKRFFGGRTISATLAS
jgi:hypothetical protein